MNRYIKQVVHGHQTMDGAGVSLKRIFSYPQVETFDPFLMLDSFGTNDPDAKAGFPWHPHRGIITISYMLKGGMEHEDSMGNHGIITAGGVQWMKAASGIVHQEMPQPGPKGIRGLQLWLNLPASLKMSPPAYGDIVEFDIPVVLPKDGVSVKVTAGTVDGVTGPLFFEQTQPEIYEIRLDTGCSCTLPTDERKTFFVVAFEPGAFIDGKAVPEFEASLLSLGDSVTIMASGSATSILLVGGNRLDEPVAWEGPIVMNTQDELMVAFDEYRKGTFIK